jgi:hypothetical protein
MGAEIERRPVVVDNPLASTSLVIERVEAVE